MSLRIRKNGKIFCAALTNELDGDMYIDDNLHYHLSVETEVLRTYPEPEHTEKGGQWFWRHEAPEGMQDNIEEAGSESSTGSESLIRTTATAYSITDSTTGGHTKYDINVDEEGVLLITSGGGDHLLIESREVLDCISSLSSKLFDECDK